MPPSRWTLVLGVIAPVESLVANDLWPTAPDVDALPERGDLALLYVPEVGYVGEAEIEDMWTGWTARQRRRLGQAAAGGGGFSLAGACLWEQAIAADPAPVGPVDPLSEHEWGSVQALRADGRLWQPDGMPPLEEEQLAWLAVEEVFDATATVELTRWPRFRDGRLRFPPGSQHLTVDRGPLRAGTVMAAQVRWDQVDTEHAVMLEALLAAPPIDITDAARELAQAGFYAAIAGAASEDQVANLGLEEEAR